MAVNIDRVYQKVLALANKEQRGYITPQEFNLFADQAQMEIFEQYFYDINQWGRKHGNSTGHSDMLTNLEEKVSVFERYDIFTNVIGDTGDVVMGEIVDLYRIEMISVEYGLDNGFVSAEEIQLNELQKYGNSPLGLWSKKHPVYTRYTGDVNPLELRVYPNPDATVDQFGNPIAPLTDRVFISYVKVPLTPNWNYVVVGDKALYDVTQSTNFELHPSEEPELIYRILALGGISIEKPQLTQIAAGLEQAKVQQEKQ